MYNGIGLPTPRGSGTNGHVQRNWALIKPREKNKSYRSEGELMLLDTAKQPNKEILDHKRKRKIELKCAEFAEILEEQGYSEETIKHKVNNYRSMLMSHDGKSNDAVDQEGKPCVIETHQVAEAQQEKNARLREAFGISEYFIDGSSFDPNRQAKEQVAKQEKETEATAKLEKEKEIEKQQAMKYELVHTPSPEPLDNETNRSEKRKRRQLSSSSEEIRKKKKLKKRKRDRSGKSKNKKRKKRKQHSSSTSDSTNKWNSSFEKSDESNSGDERRKKRKKKKEKQKVKKRQQSSSDSSRESSLEPTLKKRRAEKSYSKGYDNQPRNKSESNRKKNDNSCNNQYTPQSNEGSGRESNKKTFEKALTKKSQKFDSGDRQRQPATKGYKSRRGCEPSMQSDDDKSNHEQKSAARKRDSNSIDRKYNETRSRSRSSKTEDSRKEVNKKIMDKKNYSNKKTKSRSRNNSKSLVRSRERSMTRNTEKFFLEKKKHDKEKCLEKHTDARVTAEGEKERKIKASCRGIDANIYEGGKKRSRTPTTSISTNAKYAKNEYEPYKKSYEKRRSGSRDRSSETEYRNKISEEYNSNTRRLSVSTDMSPNLQNIKLSVKRCSPDVSLRADLLHSDKLLELPEKSNQTTKPSKAGKYEVACSSVISNEKQEYKKHPELREKHKDAIEKEKQYKKSLTNKPPMPVVRLRSSSEGESSEDDCNNIDEEHEKELRMLRLLKSGLAAKAKESIEKKIPKTCSDPFSTVSVPTSTGTHKQQNLFSLTYDNKTTHMDSNVFDFKMLSLNREKSPSINFHIQLKAKATSDDDDEGGHGRKELLLRKLGYNSSRSRSKSKSKSKSCERKSRSRSTSASSHSSNRRSTHSRTSSSSSSKSSRSISRSRSRSSSRSGTSSRTSSSISRSRSPSIPRRHGSPSFLDRRRITSKK